MNLCVIIFSFNILITLIQGKRHKEHYLSSNLSFPALVFPESYVST